MARSKCRVVGCNRKVPYLESPEEVCEVHTNVVRQFDRQRLECSMHNCRKVARSSGYCPQHSDDNYTQRPDLLRGADSKEAGFPEKPEMVRILTDARKKAAKRLGDTEWWKRVETGRRL